MRVAGSSGGGVHVGGGVTSASVDKRLKSGVGELIGMAVRARVGELVGLGVFDGNLVAVGVGVRDGCRLSVGTSVTDVLRATRICVAGGAVTAKATGPEGRHEAINPARANRRTR